MWKNIIELYLLDMLGRSFTTRTLCCTRCTRKNTEYVIRGSIKDKGNKFVGWGRIMEGLKVIKENCGMIIGDGKSTVIMQDRSVNGKGVKFRDPQMEQQHDRPCLVANLIHLGKWKEYELLKWFELEDAKRTLAVHIPKPNCRDWICWRGTRNGTFMSKSAYGYLCKAKFSWKADNRIFS